MCSRVVAGALPQRTHLWPIAAAMAFLSQVRILGGISI